MFELVNVEEDEENEFLFELLSLMYGLVTIEQGKFRFKKQNPPLFALLTK